MTNVHLSRAATDALFNAKDDLIKACKIASISSGIPKRRAHPISIIFILDVERFRKNNPLLSPLSRNSDAVVREELFNYRPDLIRGFSHHDPTPFAKFLDAYGVVVLAAPDAGRHGRFFRKNLLHGPQLDVGNRPRIANGRRI